MGYVETLFGHQDSIHAIDSLKGQHCVSVGGRDKTARYWKIVDETQLVFRGGGRSRVRELLEGGIRAGDEDDEDHQAAGSSQFVEGSMDSIALLDESTFVSGGDSGYVLELLGTGCTLMRSQLYIIMEHPKEEASILSAGCAWCGRCPVGGWGAHPITSLDHFLSQSPIFRPVCIRFELYFFNVSSNFQQAHGMGWFGCGSWSVRPDPLRSLEQLHFLVW